MGLLGEIGQAASGASGAGIDMIFSLIGSAMAAGDYQKATDLYQSYLTQVQGNTTPTYQTETAQEDNNTNEIPVQSEGRSAQSAAIQKMQDFANQNGLDSSARAGVQQALGASDQQAQAQRGAIMQGAARRGMQGSGSELASLLQGQQGASNASRNSSLNLAGQARQRALAALQSSADTGSQMRGQDIGAQAQNMNAAQQREMFNAKMRQATQGANNAGAFDQYNAQLAHLQQIGQANNQAAQDDINRAKRTQGQMSSLGQGFDYSLQAAGEGSANSGY